MEIKNVKEIVSTLIESKDSIIFCGSGISYNSGIPTVDPLINYLFQKLQIENSHIQAFKKTNFPFEAIMEMISEMADIKPLLKVFDCKNPNSNHYYFAKLLIEGFTNIIITTNFDQNIEIALKDLGAEQKKDFELLSTPDQILNFKFINTKKYVIKLHGSIIDSNSLLTFINKVASQQNIGSITRFLCEIFKAPQKNIIFFGYSFSDHFDINPALKKINCSNKNVFIFNHQEVWDKEGIEYTYNKLIEKNCYTLFYNLDKIIRELYDNPKLNISIQDWKIKVDQWINQSLNPLIYNTGINNRNIINTNLFIRTGHIQIGNYYLQKAINETPNNNNHVYRTDLLYKIALIKINVGRSKHDLYIIQEAVEDLLHAKSITQENNDYNNEAIYTGTLGYCYMLLKDYDKSICCHTEAINFFGKQVNNSQDPNIEAIKKRYCENLFYLAANYRNQRIFDLAKINYEKAIELESCYGLLELKELALYGLGLLNIQINDFSSAFNCFADALEISKNLKLRDRIWQNFSQICYALNITSGYNSCIEFYNKNFHLVENFEPQFKSLNNILRNVTFGNQSLSM